LTGAAASASASAKKIVPMSTEWTEPQPPQTRHAMTPEQFQAIVMGGTFEETDWLYRRTGEELTPLFPGVYLEPDGQYLVLCETSIKPDERSTLQLTALQPVAPGSVALQPAMLQPAIFQPAPLQPAPPAEAHSPLNILFDRCILPVVNLTGVTTGVLIFYSTFVDAITLSDSRCGGIVLANRSNCPSASAEKSRNEQFLIRGGSHCSWLTLRDRSDNGRIQVLEGSWLWKLQIENSINK
jgi:hypothetical protein